MTADQNLETAAYSTGPAVSELPGATMVADGSVKPEIGGRVLHLLDVWESVANNRYQITQQVTLSPFSEVYKATDWGAEGEGAVALKVFHEPDAATSRRVAREIQAHMLLDGQPGIVPFSDSGVLEKHDQPYRYLATRFSEGGTLADRIKQDPNNVDFMQGMASQLLSALGVMHRQDMIHRDIKPENILVGDEGDTFELTDFGIVDLNRFRDMGEAAPVDSAIEMPRDRLSGTLGFIAPEAFGNDEPIGPEVDVFGLGVVLFQGLTGELLFASSEIHEYKIAVTRESPVPLSSLNRMVPAVLEELTMESLRKDPRDRPTVDELATRLQAA